jgi:threonine dehydrogenase-like Zn-dependent dehydrogenase
MGNYQARTRLVAGSICNSTDLKLLHGTFPGCTDFPAVLGHEAVGEVIATGDKVRNYRVGDLVIRPRVCFPKEFGIREYFGSFAELGYVTDQWAINEDTPPAEANQFGHPQQVLPAGTDPMLGVLAITLKETLSWTRRFDVGSDTRVLVFGTGPVGTAFVLFSRMLGAKQVILAGRTDSSIARSSAICHPDATINIADPHFVVTLHEMTDGEGIDRAVEGVGDTSIIDMAVPCLSPNGRVGLYGVAPSTQAKALHANHPRVISINPDESEVHDEFFGLVSAGRIDPYAFMSHRLPVEQIAHGFELLASKEAFKVGLDW